MRRKYKLIQSLSRAFLIIDCFNERERELTLNQISDKADLNINTTRGLVQTLLFYNYLSFDEERNRYRLGIVFIEKAEIAQYDYTEKVIQKVKADLQKVADRYAVSTRLLSISNINASNLIECVPSRSRYVLTIHDQTDFPLNASATGKLILAYMDDERRENVLPQLKWEKHGKNTILDSTQLLETLSTVQSEGIAFEREELGDGYSSIALPVFNEGELIYSVSTSGTSEIISKNKKELVEVLCRIVSIIDGVMKEQN